SSYSCESCTAFTAATPSSLVEWTRNAGACVTPLSRQPAFPAFFLFLRVAVSRAPRPRSFITRARTHVYCRKKNPRPPRTAAPSQRGGDAVRGGDPRPGRPAGVGNVGTVTPAPARRRRRRRPGAHARDSDDDRLGAELAIAEAHRLFVGGAAPQPPA